VVNTDIRSIQKTGNMHYLYLPTSWCKKHSIKSDSKVSLDIDTEGNLNVIPQAGEKKEKTIKLNIAEKDMDILMKFIVACYINPTTSFKINIEKGTDFTKLLNQTKLIGGLDLIELDGNCISYESPLSVVNPDSLLKIMIRKIKNLITVKNQGGNKELINRYEDEIDKSHFLIDKSVISSLTFSNPNISIKHVDLFYIGSISQDLESLADHVIELKESETDFLNKTLEIINHLQKIIDNLSDNKFKNLDHKTAIDFAKEVLKIESIKVKDLESYDKRRIQKKLANISEILVDWSITKKLED